MRMVSFIALISISILLSLLLILWRSFKKKPKISYRRCFKASHKKCIKPKWVKREVLRLCSFLPDHGCRKIANQFNRIYINTGESVSKSYVYSLRKNHQYEIRSIRRRYKNRVPKEIPLHKIWGLDLTGKHIDQKNHQTLGIIDHGSRLLLQLKYVRSKSTLQILKIILDTIETYGKPEAIRTDNESIFTSLVFKVCLKFIGVSHQRTQLHSPWQNGRIERLFRTFKEKANCVAFENTKQYTHFLETFKFWYNHARPHQHLGGLTPYEYASKDLRSPKKVKLYDEYDGLFRGIIIERLER